MIALTETGKLTMFKPKVSLVFPCWHAAKHMKHVLEDLQAQTFKDFEAILVNDGDDGQVEAMEAIAAQDSRIRIVNLSQNSGVAAARNAGTDAATTEWVAYPDSDDRFGPNYLKSLYEAVDGTEVDLVCGGYTVLHMNIGRYEHHYIETNKSPITVNIADGYEKMLSSYTAANTWNKLYNKKLIIDHKLKQDINFINGQDICFNLSYYPFVKQVGLVCNCDYLYHYSIYNTNWSRYNPNWMKNHLQIIKMQEELHRQIGWVEQRIIEYRDKTISYDCLKMFKNLFEVNSPLTIREAENKIEIELLHEPMVVNAILQQNFGKDRIMKLIQYLIRKGKAYQLSVTFMVLVNGKRLYGKLYNMMKPFFRGE